MDGTRAKRWWFPSLQVRFQRKFRRPLKTTLLFIYFQRMQGQPPLQERTEEDMESGDDAADDDDATVTSKEDTSD